MASEPAQRLTGSKLRPNGAAAKYPYYFALAKSGVVRLKLSAPSTYSDGPIDCPSPEKSFNVFLIL